MDPPANPRMGLAGGRLLFSDRTLMARSGILAIRESFSSSLGRLGRQVRCGWWIVSGLIVGRCGDGHSHWHDDAEAAAWVAADAGAHFVAETQGRSDFQGVRQIGRVEGDHRRLAVDLHGHLEARRASVGIPVVNATSTKLLEDLTSPQARSRYQPYKPPRPL